MKTDELKSLLPNLSEDELAAAKENLERYLLLVWEIMEDCEDIEEYPLTTDDVSTSIKTKVDSHKT